MLCCSSALLVPIGETVCISVIEALYKLPLVAVNCVVKVVPGGTATHEPCGTVEIFENRGSS